MKFVPQNVEFEIKPNQTILHLAQENGLHIKSVCKGIPSCAECRIQIDEGEYNVMPPSQAELNLIGTAHFVDHRRLACQLRCFGDITVNLSEQEEKASQVVNSKRPRGYVHKADGEESRAVMGNVLDEEQSQADLNERTANLSLQEEEIRRELARVKIQKTPVKDPLEGSSPSRHEGGRPRREDRGGNSGPRRDRGNRPNRGQSASEGQTQHAQASAAANGGGGDQQRSEKGSSGTDNKAKRSRKRRRPKRPAE